MRKDKLAVNSVCFQYVDSFIHQKLKSVVTQSTSCNLVCFQVKDGLVRHFVLQLLATPFVFITTRQRSCGKVRFSLACVCSQEGWACLVPGPFLRGWVCQVPGPFQRVGMPDPKFLLGVGMASLRSLRGGGYPRYALLWKVHPQC